MNGMSEAYAAAGVDTDQSDKAVVAIVDQLKSAKPDGSNFDWFSYLGGSGEDVGYDLALDKDNNVFVTGITNSDTTVTPFPLRPAVSRLSFTV